MYVTVTVVIGVVTAGSRGSVTTVVTWFGTHVVLSPMIEKKKPFTLLLITIFIEDKQNKNSLESFLHGQGALFHSTILFYYYFSKYWSGK